MKKKIAKSSIVSNKPQSDIFDLVSPSDAFIHAFTKDNWEPAPKYLNRGVC
jgi:hypothetical protein